MIYINGIAHITVEEHEQALGDQAREHYHDLAQKDVRIGQLIDELIMANRVLRQMVDNVALASKPGGNIEGTG